MIVGTPLVKTEQDSSIRIEDLPKVLVVGRRSRLTEQRLVPLEAARHVAYANDRPRALHCVSLRRCLAPTCEIEEIGADILHDRVHDAHKQEQHRCDQTAREAARPKEVVRQYYYCERYDSDVKQRGALLA